MTAAILEKVAELLQLCAKNQNIQTYSHGDPQSGSICVIFIGNLEGSEPSILLSENEGLSKSAYTATVKEAADAFGVSPKTIRKLILKGDLEVLNNLRPYKITRQSLNRYRSGMSHQPNSTSRKRVTSNMLNDVEKRTDGEFEVCHPRVGVLQSDIRFDEDIERASQEVDQW